MLGGYCASLHMQTPAVKLALMKTETDFSTSSTTNGQAVHDEVISHMEAEIVVSRHSQTRAIKSHAR